MTEEGLFPQFWHKLPIQLVTQTIMYNSRWHFTLEINTYHLKYDKIMRGIKDVIIRKSVYNQRTPYNIVWCLHLSLWYHPLLPDALNLVDPYRTTIPSENRTATASWFATYPEPFLSTRGGLVDQVNFKLSLRIGCVLFQMVWVNTVDIYLPTFS